MIRKQVLLYEKHQKLAKRYAKQLKASESEVIRRALEAYDPESDAEIEALAQLLQESTQRAESAVDHAIEEVDKTTRFYRHRKQQQAYS